MKHERWPLSFSYILCNIAIRRLPCRFVMIMGYIEEILTITNKKNEYALVQFIDFGCRKYYADRVAFLGLTQTR